MSSTLSWRPTGCGTPLPDTLKRILLEHRYGTCAGPWKLSEREDGDYFSGLADAGVEGADTVCAALQHHGMIELEISY